MRSNDWMKQSIIDFDRRGAHVGGVPIESLIVAHGTPLFVFSAAKLRERSQQVKKAFGSRCPAARVFYASKANSNLHILRLLRDEGLNVEVNSGGELFKVLRAGFDPAQVVFNGVAKSASEISEALAVSINAINVDSLCELERVCSLAKGSSSSARVALRMVPEVKTGSSAGLETGTHESKFGMDHVELAEAAALAKLHKGTVQVVGLHMHIGSQTPSLDKYCHGIDALLRTAEELLREHGIAVEHVNIGGGIPIPYLHDTDPWRDAAESSANEISMNAIEYLSANLNCEDVADAVCNRLQECLQRKTVDSEYTRAWTSLANVELYVEPGRYVTGESAILLTEIQSARNRSGDPTGWLMLDAGFNVLLEAFDYSWYFPAVSASRITDPHDTPYRLAGPLCDGGDVFLDHEGFGRLPETRQLPSATEPGDILAFLNVGAYTLEQMMQYNGQRRAAAVMVDNGQVTVIRKRDSYEDLILHDEL